MARDIDKLGAAAFAQAVVSFDTSKPVPGSWGEPPASGEENGAVFATARLCPVVAAPAVEPFRTRIHMLLNAVVEVKPAPAGRRRRQDARDAGYQPSGRLRGGPEVSTAHTEEEWAHTEQRSRRTNALPPAEAGHGEPRAQQQASWRAAHSHAHMRGPPGAARALVGRPYATSTLLGVSQADPVRLQRPVDGARRAHLDLAAVRAEAEERVGPDFADMLSEARAGGQAEAARLIGGLERQLEDLAREMTDKAPALTEDVRLGQRRLGTDLEARAGSAAGPGPATLQRMRSQGLMQAREPRDAEAGDDVVCRSPLREVGGIRFRVNSGMEGAHRGMEAEEDGEGEERVKARVADAARQARRFRLLAPQVNEAKRLALGLPMTYEARNGRKR